MSLFGIAHPAITAGSFACASSTTALRASVCAGMGGGSYGGTRGSASAPPKYFVTSAIASAGSKSPAIESTALFGA